MVVAACILFPLLLCIVVLLIVDDEEIREIAANYVSLFIYIWIGISALLGAFFYIVAENKVEYDYERLDRIIQNPTITSNDSESNTSSDKTNTMQSAKLTQSYSCLGVLYAGTVLANSNDIKDNINNGITNMKRKYRKEFNRDELNKYMEKGVRDMSIEFYNERFNQMIKKGKECLEVLSNL